MLCDSRCQRGQIQSSSAICVPSMRNLISRSLKDSVFDATASRAVLAKLEWTRKIHFQRVPIASLVLGPRAEKGMVLVTGAGHSGGPLDAGRSAKLRLLRERRGKTFLEEFFPESP